MGQGTQLLQIEKSSCRCFLAHLVLALERDIKSCPVAVTHLRLCHRWKMSHGQTDCRQTADRLRCRWSHSGCLCYWTVVLTLVTAAKPAS